MSLNAEQRVCIRKSYEDFAETIRIMYTELRVAGFDNKETMDILLTLLANNCANGNGLYPRHRSKSDLIKNFGKHTNARKEGAENESTETR